MFVWLCNVCLTLRSHGLQPTRLLCLWNSPGKNTGVGSHSLLQGIFLTQGSNLGLLHYRQILYHLSHQGSPTLDRWGGVQSSQESPSLSKDETVRESTKESCDDWNPSRIFESMSLQRHFQKHLLGAGFSEQVPPILLGWPYSKPISASKKKKERKI